MTTLKEKLTEISDRGVFDTIAPGKMLEFAAEIVEAVLASTEENEPHATNSIHAMKETVNILLCEAGELEEGQ